VHVLQEGVLQQFRDGGTFLRIALQTLENGIATRGRLTVGHIDGEVGIGVEQCALRGVVAVQRILAEHHLIENAAEGPHISRAAVLVHVLLLIRVVLCGDQGLGGNVSNGAAEIVVYDRGRDCLFGDGLGDAKVDQTQLTLHQHKIGRLQVPVNDLVLVYRLHCDQHLQPVVANRIEVEDDAAWFARIHRTRQICFSVLEDDVQSLVGDLVVDQSVVVM
jgi:hypothetical protein